MIHDTDDSYESIKVGGKNDLGSALTFVMLARMRGWVVTEPEDNGFGYYHVGVLSRGPEDERDQDVETEYQRRVDAAFAAADENRTRT